MILVDPAAERGVLAGLFLFGSNAYMDVADIVRTESFAIRTNQILFACLEHILRDRQVDKVDFPSVLSAANSLGLSSAFDKTEDAAHLRGVMKMVVEPPTVRHLAARVRKLEITRDLKGEVKAIEPRLEAVTGDEPLEEIVGLAENPICEFATRLAGGNSSGPGLMGEGAAEYYQYLIDNPRQMMGVPTPYTRYNRAIGGGLRGNGVDLIGARQKSGKTFLVDNIGLHIAGVVKVPVLNIDREMTKEEHQIRVGACLADIPSESIERGKLSREEKKRLMEASERLSTFPYFYDSVIGMEFEDILARMRRWVMRTVGLAGNGKANPCVIIFDYLKLISATAIKNNIAEHQLLRFMTSGLKNFMGRYGVSCLAFAQLNRDGIDYEDTRVIRGSDGILDDVTSFSIYKWKADEERASESGESRTYTHKLMPLICRHGPGLRDGDYINMRATYERAKIAEGPTKSEMAAGSAATQKGFVVNDTKQGQIGFGETEESSQEKASPPDDKGR